MSAEKRGRPFHGGGDLSSLFMAEIKAAGGGPDDGAALQVFENPQTAAAAPPLVSLADYLHGPATMDYGLLAWTSFDLVPAGSQVDASSVGGALTAVGGVARPTTPNSSMSTSSMENFAAGEEESGHHRRLDPAKQEEAEKLQAKGDDSEGRDLSKSKKVNKAGKKKEKRERAPRFAFMTKSEEDHLEDGYRWRKYGQKAVKNSPFPRSYYRCTAQSCSVKKRVERSYQDPATVVTTYEGQHTHHSPANYFRGSTHYFLSAAPSPPPPPFPTLSFRRNLHFCHSSSSSRLGDDRCINPNAHAAAALIATSQQLPPAELGAPDYGLLQDIVSSSPPYTAANYNN